MTMTPSTSYSYSQSDFDTQIYGIQMGRVESIDPNASEIDLRDLTREVQERGYRYMTYRINTKHADMIMQLQRCGWDVIDGIVSSTISLDGHRAWTATGPIERSTMTDVSELQSIALGSFGHARFYTDHAYLPRAKSDELHELWIKNSLLGLAADEVWVTRDQGVVTSFVTIKLHDQKATIVLFAVAPHARGRGVAKTCITGLLADLSTRGVAQVTVDTQLSNIPAIRTYLSTGFRPTESYYTLRWTNLSVDDHER